MSFVSTQTMIPLYRMAFHLGIDPYHFFQQHTSDRPLKPSCADDWYQYDWQSVGKLSREALALALRQAEDMVVEYLNWSPLPMWHEEEVQLPIHYKTERSSNVNAVGKPKSLVTRWSYVIEPGRRASTLIDTPATVFSDPDGDGINELVTITFATTVTEEQDLRVYYPSKSGDPNYEIRPLTSVSISGGVATITFPKYLIPLELLINKPSSDDDPHIYIDAEVDTNFCQEVDVYWVRPDLSQQITFYYDPSDSCSTVPCAESTDTGCLFIKDSRRGIMSYTKATWDATTEAYTSSSFTKVPVKAMVYYRAGKLDNRQSFPELQMDQALERFICYFALSFLDTELCGCDNTRKIWQHMTRDLSLNDGDTSYVVPWADLGNPLGTTFAAVRLWKYLQQIEVERALVRR